MGDEGDAADPYFDLEESFPETSQAHGKSFQEQKTSETWNSQAKRGELGYKQIFEKPSKHETRRPLGRASKFQAEGHVKKSTRPNTTSGGAREGPTWPPT